jgi:hypothetical protein
MDLMMEDIEEVILALKAAGYSTPQYEILPDGAVHYFYGTKKDNSLLHRDESRGQDGRDNT